MVSIKGTEKIKGVVDISSLKLQIKKGATYLITKEQLYSPDVQTAVKMRLIEVLNKGEVAGEQAEESQTRVTLRNVSKKPVTLVVDDNSLEPTEVFKFKKKEFKSTTLQPQQSVMIKEFQLKNSEIKSAIAAGFLEVVNKPSVETTKEQETTIRLSGKYDIEQLSRELETNEEIITANNVIDTENPAPVKKKDIPDDRKVKSVVWNPTKRPILGKTIKADPWEPKETEELSFTDKEEAEKRIKTHPILKDKVPPTINNNEITMVDKQAEQDRIDAHPKLGKKAKHQTQESALDSPETTKESLDNPEVTKEKDAS